MSYLEELLPEFRKGAKIRRKNWPEGHYVKIDTSGKFTVDKNNKLYTIYAEEMTADNWEFYQKSEPEPNPDWDYIIKKKCLCWFWDDEEDDKVVGILREIIPNIKYKFNGLFLSCRLVRRDEVTFYEDRKDEKD